MLVSACACEAPSVPLGLGIPDAACGVSFDGGEGHASSAGKYAGLDPNVRSASYRIHILDSGVAAEFVDVDSEPNDCSLETRRVLVAGSSVIGMEIKPGPIAPGTYDVLGGIFHYDDACKDTIQDPNSERAKGTVTLSCLDPLIGEFELSFPSGEQILGNFVAPRCGFEGISNPPPIICQP
jgi:hypothetical protein